MLTFQTFALRRKKYRPQGLCEIKRTTKSLGDVMSGCTDVVPAVVCRDIV